MARCEICLEKSAAIKSVPVNAASSMHFGIKCRASRTSSLAPRGEAGGAKSSSRRESRSRSHTEVPPGAEIDDRMAQATTENRGSKSSHIDPSRRAQLNQLSARRGICEKYLFEARNEVEKSTRAGGGRPEEIVASCGVRAKLDSYEMASTVCPALIFSVSFCPPPLCKNEAMVRLGVNHCHRFLQASSASECATEICGS